MLRHLRVRNLALLEDISLELGGGLTVVTGETGAGKSLLIDALGVLGGGRSPASLVRSSTDRATVEALFEISPESLVARRLSESGLDSEEPGELILRRELFASGRGRCSVNGRLVPMQQLAETAGLLFEINNQHEQQSLLEAGVQRDFFDEFAQLAVQRRAVAARYDALRVALAERDALAEDARGREQRRDFLRFQVEELEGLALRPGERGLLEAERHRLAHVEQLMALGAEALAALADGADGAASALDLVGVGAKNVEQMATHDAGLRGVVEAVLEAQSRLSDAAFDLGRYVSRLEADPGRLEEVADRLDAIQKALRKHGGSEEEVLSRLEEMRAELDRLENWETSREGIERRVAECRLGLREAAVELRAGRGNAQVRFLRPLVALLRDFSMPKVRVELRVSPVGSGLALDEAGTLCGPAGLDEVELLFCANEGEQLQPLRKVASGGELSRLMLALRTLQAQKGEIPLLVFDEVDAGVSGGAARRVAERLAALGESCQILCVTHNPSIAAAAAQHFVVEKKQAQGRTHSVIAPAEGLRRQAELARLLDGGKRSEKGMALAAEMLAG